MEVLEIDIARVKRSGSISRCQIDGVGPGNNATILPPGFVFELQPNKIGCTGILPYILPCWLDEEAESSRQSQRNSARAKRKKIQATPPLPRGSPMCSSACRLLLLKIMGNFPCRLEWSCRHAREWFTSSLAVALSYSKLKSPNDRGFVFFDRFGKNCLVPSRSYTRSQRL